MSAKHTAAFLSNFAWALSALLGVLGLVWLWNNAPVVLGIWVVFAAPVSLLYFALLHGGRD